MRRSQSTLAALLLGLAVVGCADQQPTSPAVGPELPEAPNAAIIVTYMSPDETSADFIVTPSGGYFTMGPHGIYFPRNSICDPARSTYGVTEWDKPCTVLREPIRIHAEVRHVNGVHWVDFTPSLRFAPKRRASDWVWIWMRTNAVEQHDALEDQGYDVPKLEILWSPALGAPGIDESIADRTQKTRYDSRHGFAYRRIKHFSGYQVHDGYAASLSGGGELELDNSGPGSDSDSWTSGTDSSGPSGSSGSGSGSGSSY